MAEPADGGLRRAELLARSARVVAGGAVAGLGLPSLASGKASPLVELRKAIGPGRVVAAGDPRYATVRVPWNRRYDVVRPAAVALPTSPQHVAACISWARKHGVPFAIRGGGHSFAGQSSSKGLVIDLRRLAAVSASQNKARIGAGARLGAVYAALWGAGHRTIPAGTAPTVGIGGLTLGGGHGYLARLHGLACDNLLAAEIVTADGKLRTCNATNEKELFWALRGAGFGSFGVVTSLVFRTTAVGPVTTVSLEWEWARAAEMIDSWTAFMGRAPDELSTSLALRVPPTAAGTPKVAMNGLFAGTKADALATLEPFLAETAPTKVSIIGRSYDVATRYFAGAQSDKRRFIGAASGYAQAPLTASGRGGLIELVTRRRQSPELRGGGAVLFALGGAVGRVPTGATAFAHRHALFSVEFVGLWDSPDETESNRAWFDEARATMSSSLVGAVPNYADPDLPEWKAAYYGNGLARLRKVKRAVDPNNVFRHSQSIPPASNR